MCIIIFPSKIWAKKVHYTRQNTAPGFLSNMGRPPETTKARATTAFWLANHLVQGCQTHCQKQAGRPDSASGPCVCHL